MLRDYCFGLTKLFIYIRKVAGRKIQRQRGNTLIIWHYLNIKQLYTFPDKQSVFQMQLLIFFTESFNRQKTNLILSCRQGTQVALKPFFVILGTWQI